MFLLIKIICDPILGVGVPKSTRPTTVSKSSSHSDGSGKDADRPVFWLSFDAFEVSLSLWNPRSTPHHWTGLLGRHVGKYPPNPPKQTLEIHSQCTVIK